MSHLRLSSKANALDHLLKTGNQHPKVLRSITADVNRELGKDADDQAVKDEVADRQQEVFDDHNGEIFATMVVGMQLLQCKSAMTC